MRREELGEPAAGEVEETIELRPIEGPVLSRALHFDEPVGMQHHHVRIHLRVAILEVHSKGKPLDKDVALDVLAKRTPGFSGADLANLVNEAAIMAARENKKRISMPEFEEAIDRVMLGPERKSRVRSAKENEMVAYHESGHALVTYKLEDFDPLFKITIVSRGESKTRTRRSTSGLISVTSERT